MTYHSKLIVRGAMPNLNTVIAATKKHWSHYSREKKKWTQTVRMEALAQKITPVTQPVWIRSEYFSKNKRADPDGIRIAAKYILDGLVEANVLPDDSQKWIIGFVDRFDVDKDDPRIEVELMPEPDAL
jgi:hypothetical protein